MDVVNDVQRYIDPGILTLVIITLYVSYHPKHFEGVVYNYTRLTTQTHIYLFGFS